MTCSGSLVLVTRTIQDGAPVTFVFWREPQHPNDSGFDCFSDADPLDASKLGDDDLAVLCLDCFLGDHPEAGRGMDAARREGAACLDGGRWMAS